MIAYIFSNDFLKKVILPKTINGVYALYNNQDKFLCNIEEIEGKWTLKKNSAIDLFVDNNSVQSINVDNFKVYQIKDLHKNEMYSVIFLPRYDINTIKLNAKSNEVKIGNSGEASIKYLFPQLGKFNISLNKENGLWNLNTESSQVFLNDIQKKTGKILHGDYIFYFGLKVIIINDLFIINNPNGFVSYNPAILTEHVPTPVAEDIDLLVDIDDDQKVYDSGDYFFKAPRFTSLLEEITVKVDEPPAPPEENDMPTLLTVGPQLTMVATSSITLVNYLNSYLDGSTTFSRFIFSMSTISITIVGALLWPTLTRKFNKKRRKKLLALRKKRYFEYLEKKEKEVLVAKQRQRQVLIDNSISLAEVKTIVDNHDRRLWERNVDHEDFLSVRLGNGVMPSKINVSIPEEKFSLYDMDDLEESHKKLVDTSLYLEDVPMSISLVEKNITAIIESNAFGKKFLNGLFLRICSQHDYTELKIVIFTNKKNSKKWDFLKVLPHAWSNDKSIRYFADNAEDTNVIASEIDKIFDLRQKKDVSEQKEEDGKKADSHKPYKDYKPYFLIFTDDVERVRNLSFIKKILRYKVNYGFSLLMLNDKLATLPSETTTFLHISENVSGMITNELSTNNQLEFKADFLESIDIYDCAQKLANIPIHVNKAKYELPSSLSFLELYKVGKVEHLNCLDRWKNNNPVLNISVPVGIDQNGEIFKMDIHEKQHGPHGLVAGTTGSGKSEWIVTYILSLAVNFSPEEMQFVLIDYKGGGLAMSFENAELGIKLPHIAGIITNLDKSAINRSIASIESELKRRQTIFNETREKLKEGSMNIYKYQELYRKKLVDEPMSHLLIISDEFAELKQQQPEFMDQLISTSRIGRSLGVHLILATQKPSGVVNDQIWSNSKFKVCLKVQNQSDSNEILKKPDAAFLKTAGAFYLSVGNDDYYNLGQSAWAGAKYFPSDAVIKKIDQSIEVIDDLGRTISTYDDDIVETSKESKGEELINIVSYIDSLSKKNSFILKDLWLPNIPEESFITTLIKQYSHTPTPYLYDIAIGQYDEPRKQEQGLLKINISKGNIGIIGQTGSGKNQLVSTIIWSAMIEHQPTTLNIYILDFGGETLKKFAGYPHVGEVVYQDDMDKALGVLDLISDELDKRKSLFENFNGSFEYYNKYSDNKVPLILLVIHGFDIFSDLMPRVNDFLLNLLRDCSKYGIILMLTASSQNGIKSRQMGYINEKIVLQMNDDNIYRSITNCRRGLIPGKVVGRGICRLGDDDDSYAEFQTAMIAPANDEYQFIKSYGEQLSAYYNYKAKELAKIPDDVTSKDLTKYITDLNNLPIGYDFYQKDVAMYDLLSTKIHLFSTKNMPSAIDQLYGFVNVLSQIQNTKVRVIDLIGKYKNPNIDLKLFNDNFDTVFAALENDVLNRDKNQATAVNIILGAGLFKNKLSEAGYEIASNMFNNLAKPENIITILFDTYENIRGLKVEPWFPSIDTTKGLWFGNGISGQTLIQVEDLSIEDSKLEFDKMGYKITDSKYNLIKLVSDGE